MIPDYHIIPVKVRTFSPGLSGGTLGELCEIVLKSPRQIIRVAEVEVLSQVD